MFRLRARGGPAAAVAAALCALALAACGDDSGAASGVADAVPADSVIYGAATIRPDGDQKAALDALVDRFGTGLDPGALIGSALDSQAADNGIEDFSFAADVEPWLGEQAGVFFLDPEENGAFIVESTDDDAAQAAVDKLLASGGEAEDRSYEGHDYKVGEDDAAVAVSDGLVIAGTPPAIEAALATLDGGDALEAAQDEGSFASLYVDVAATVEAAGGVDATGQQILNSFAPHVLDQPVNAALSLDSQTVALDLSYGSLGLINAFGYTGGTSPLLRELPADAWGATASADVGAAYSQIIEAVKGGEFPEATTGQLDELERQVQAATGESLEDALAQIGDVGAFIRGSGGELSGGAVIELSDPATAPGLVGALRSAIARQPGTAVKPVAIGGARGFAVSAPSLSQPVYVVVDGDRAVIALGSAATQDALDPGSTLGDSSAFARAEAGFGDDPAIGTFVDPVAAVDALAATGGADPAELALVKPYLEQLAYVAAGASDDGETGRSRIVVGFD